MNESWLTGNSPRVNLSSISLPSRIILPFALDSGWIWPTTWGKSELNFISLSLNSIITSPGSNPALSADSPSSTSFIRAPYGFFIPRASARSLSTSLILTPRYPLETSPFSIICSATSIATFIGIAKAKPWYPPLLE